MFMTRKGSRKRWSIAICGMNSATDYSGGRYHAWMMAEALASAGHAVTFWTDNRPVFLEDFASLPGHDRIRIERSLRFSRTPAGRFDLVLLVPHLGLPLSFYSKVMLLARRDEALLALINFESPNWFNSLSPEPRDPNLWRGWLAASRVSDVLLSLTKEGDRHAQQYYGTHLRFAYCVPSINSRVADAVEDVERERQVICITRLAPGDRHKGAHDLLEALGPEMRGTTLLLMVGSGPRDGDTIRALETRARAFDIRVRVLHRPTDHEKFREIKKSSLMLFLSHFEGLGYPPIEAQYCNTPCIVYDLPVLREVSGDGLIYIQPGDPKTLQAEIGRVLSGAYEPPRPLREGIRGVASFKAFAERLDSLLLDFEELRAAPRCTGDIAPGYWLRHRLRARTPDLDVREVTHRVRRKAEKILRGPV